MNKLLQKRLFRWGIVITYASMIFFVSSISVPDGSIPRIPHIDKVVHFIEFAVLCMLIFRALLLHKNDLKTECNPGENKNVSDLQIKSGIRYGKIAVLSILFTSIYALSDEFHQSFLPFRDSDIFDWFADVAGANTAGFLFMFIMNKSSINKRKTW